MKSTSIYEKFIEDYLNIIKIFNNYLKIQNRKENIMDCVLELLDKSNGDDVYYQALLLSD